MADQFLCPICKIGEVYIDIRETLSYLIVGVHGDEKEYAALSAQAYDGDDCIVVGIECINCNMFWRTEREFTDAVKKSQGITNDSI